MKTTTLISLLLGFLFLSCSKKEELLPVEVSKLYVIGPNDTDPLKKRLYEIYKTYGIAVFFNDTVGSYFVQNDINGNPVYRTETLDLGWLFTAHNRARYEVVEIEEFSEQMVALDYMEKYLKSISKPLYPFSILLARQVTEVTESGSKTVMENGTARNYFRTLMMTDRLASKDTVEHFKSLVKSILRSKLNSFPDDLKKFGAISKSDWYDGKYFSDLNPNVPKGTTIGLLYIPNIELNLKNRGYTDAQILEEKRKLRAVCGPYGFVSGHGFIGGYATPNDSNTDLDGFLREVLSFDRATFTAYWGAYPLVMRKYEILYELISEKLGVNL